MKKLVVLSGAGVSAESGLQTFRDSDGLWENYNVTEVATPEAWFVNPALVMEFYNQRRKQVVEAEPNAAHFDLAKLEQHFNVQIITQNIDDLHERAGSSSVLHLHGNIRYSRSTKNSSLLYPIEGWQLKLGEKCEDGHQLRPHVVWFGEPVPMMEKAAKLCLDADILVIIGTSLNVYPAASLVHYVPKGIPKFLIDPKSVPVEGVENLIVLQKKASSGVAELAQILLKNVS